METKNIIAAISLSAAVIILYSLFFAPSQDELNKIRAEKEKDKIVKNSEAPSLDNEKNISTISRNDAIQENQRINFENKNITGSISLTGSAIDDLTFKNYSKVLNGKEKVTLLNPRKIKNGYYIETGWVTNNKNIDLPNSKTNWKIDGNKKLSPNNPVKIFWINEQEIKFEKKISLDEQFLFKVEQSITNNTNKKYDFYTYGQIIRNTAPEVTNFYILHEGMLGVFDDQLVEEDYDDIEEKKYTFKATSGWLGITDKYWIASLIPEKNKNFRADFDYKNKFRTSFIETEPLEVGEKEKITNKINIIVAAKEVSVIDGYAEKLKISKYDLAIDWLVLFYR